MCVWWRKGAPTGCSCRLPPSWTIAYGHASRQSGIEFAGGAEPHGRLSFLALSELAVAPVTQNGFTDDTNSSSNRVKVGEHVNRSSKRCIAAKAAMPRGWRCRQVRSRSGRRPPRSLWFGVPGRTGKSLLSDRSPRAAPRKGARSPQVLELSSTSHPRWRSGYRKAPLASGRSPCGMIAAKARQTALSTAAMSVLSRRLAAPIPACRNRKRGRW